MAEYRLEMHGVSKSFPGVKALDKINLKVRPGTVHALMGENGAGKSTLMKCLFGIYHMDEGEVFLDGKKVEVHNPDEALQMGMAMVHQELQPIPERTVAENMYAGRYPTKKFGPLQVVDHKKMFEETAKWLEDVKMPFNPKAKLGTMSIAQMQSVEIAKAVSLQARVVILDEPTSSLTDNEVEALFYGKYKALDYIGISEEQLTGERFLYKGLDIGDQVAQIAAVYFPTVIDNFIKIVLGEKYYGRYMDDSLLLGETVEHLVGVLAKVKVIADKCGLILNPKKVKIIPLGKTFQYLQIKYSLIPTGAVIKRINPKRVTVMRRKLKKLAVMVKNGKRDYL